MPLILRGQLRDNRLHPLGEVAVGALLHQLQAVAHHHARLGATMQAPQPSQVRYCSTAGIIMYLSAPECLSIKQGDSPYSGKVRRFIQLVLL